MNIKLGEIIIPTELWDNMLIQELKNQPIILIKDEFKIDKSIPTLIIGWKNVKNKYGDRVSILNKKIHNKLYWTFEPNENLQDFNEDIEKYINMLYSDFIEDVDYNLIDPIFDNLDITIFKEQYGLFDNGYITEDFIFLYKKSENRIYGLDIKYLKYLKFNVQLLINIIYDICPNILVETYDENSIIQKYKIYFNKEINKKFIPFLQNHIEN